MTQDLRPVNGLMGTNACPKRLRRGPRTIRGRRPTHGAAKRSCGDEELRLGAVVFDDAPERIEELARSD